MTTSSSGALASDLPRRRPKGIPTLVAEGFRELLGRRRLIRYLVGAEMKRTHANTALGQVWWVLDPLLQMLVYVVLVAVILRRGTPDYPLFLFAAILPWKWFSTTLNDATLSVTQRNSLIRQIQFPKLVLPAAATFAGTVSFFVSLIALAIVYLAYLHRLGPWLLFLPVICFVQLVFTLAMAIGLAAINAFYRDIQNVLRHVVRLWFYMSPGLYSLDLLPEGTIKTLLSLNPFAVLFGAYRHVIYGTPEGPSTAPDFLGLFLLLLVSFVLLAIAIGIFKKVEPAFARIL
jgi:lipopolysaccharide transport system permease protein/teichoic acid transport system permease protein